MTPRMPEAESPGHCAARRTQIERRPGDARRDEVAIEEPLEIRVDGEALVVTMRSPGAEVELALGYLYAEGLIESAGDVEDAVVRSRSPRERGAAATIGQADPVPGSIVDVRLSTGGRGRARRAAVAARREVAFRVTSACGVCGKPSLEDLWVRLPSIRPLDLEPDHERRLVQALPARMTKHQRLFGDTGGVHAAALFEARAGSAEFLWLYEDIGRHNAVDKAIGRALMSERLPLGATMLAVSGRLGFEIVQKAAIAGVPLIAAVGAPSTLALDIAHLAGIRVYAFVAGDRSNFYPAAPVEARLVTEPD